MRYNSAKNAIKKTMEGGGVRAERKGCEREGRQFSFLTASWIRLFASLVEWARMLLYLLPEGMMLKRLCGGGWRRLQSCSHDPLATDAPGEPTALFVDVFIHLPAPPNDF